MPLYRCMVRLPWTTNLPEDVTVNVWHMAADNLTALGAAVSALQLFYNTVDQYLHFVSNSTDAASITSYDLADDEPRAPVDESTFTLSPAGGEALPPEVALCLSFQAVQVSGEPQARRRGRIYLGPIAEAQNAAGRPSTALVDDVAAAGQALLDQSVAATDWAWSVYSPTAGGAFVVDNGWVDDEWDTQRRRGRERTRRELFA